MSPETTLPPNHPPIGGGTAHGVALAASDEPPALRWKMPTDWQEAPSASTLRLATDHVPAGGEMSVVRAGGTTEANIRRWLAQFDNAGADAHEARTIHGLHVTIVQVAGTYQGSRTIVETSGSPYFSRCPARTCDQIGAGVLRATPGEPHPSLILPDSFSERRLRRKSSYTTYR
jgi:hypothetical protein